MTINYPGRVMAIDLGEKRIGIAISDAMRMIATPHRMIQRRSRREDFAEYGRIIAAQTITLVVMGLPIPLHGVEGQRAAWVRNYSSELQTQIGVPLEFWDESLTTKQAQSSLRSQGKRGKKAKAQVDAVAATFILQSFLDARRDDY